MAKPRRLAVLCGIGRYGMGLGDIPGVTEDVELLARTLSRDLHEDFRFDEVQSHLDGQVCLSGLLSILDGLRSPSPVDDLFFYLSGHGRIWRNKAYFATYGASTFTPGLRLTDLAEELERVTASRVFAVLDCCHAGAVVQGLTPLKNVPLEGTEKVAVLAAARAGELADSGATGGESFTRHFVNALIHATADERGLICWGQVALAVSGAYEGSTVQRVVNRCEHLSSYPVNRISAQRARPKKLARAPYTFVLDEVSLSYCECQRRYGVVWHKIVRNTSEEPLSWAFARVDVCAFPHDKGLARRYYRTNPVELGAIGFRAYDSEGRNLAFTALHEHDSNTELQIRFEDRETGYAAPVYPGETREYSYSISIRDAHWGPYLERHVRVPTEQLKVRLEFPAGLVECWGTTRRPCGEPIPVVPAIDRADHPGLAAFSWSTTEPELQCRYRFQWAFRDRRDLLIYEAVKSVLDGPESSPGAGTGVRPECFQRLWWNGEVYDLSSPQAAVVAQLWCHLWQSRRGLGEVVLLRNAKSRAKCLRTLFGRGAARALWDRLIVRGDRQNTYRLNVRHPVELHGIASD